MNKYVTFSTFLKSVKVHTPTLIESIQHGFKVCFENESHNDDEIYKIIKSKISKFLISLNIYQDDDDDQRLLAGHINNLSDIIMDNITAMHRKSIHKNSNGMSDYDATMSLQNYIQWDLFDYRNNPELADKTLSYARSLINHLLNIYSN